jgi:hypothetical protein
MSGSDGGHGGHDAHGGEVAVRERARDEKDVIIERAMPLVRDLAHHVDPALDVEMTPYRWHGDAVLDILLRWRGHEHHLEVSASRMRIIFKDPHLLEHDIEAVLTDMRREAHAATPDAALHETYDLPHHAPPDGMLGLRIPTRDDSELDPLHSPAAEAVDLPPSRPEPPAHGGH